MKVRNLPFKDVHVQFKAFLGKDHVLSVSNSLLTFFHRKISICIFLKQLCFSDSRHLILYMYRRTAGVCVII